MNSFPLARKMSPFQVRKIIMDTMNNIHPIYNIKILMTKRELMKDPTLKFESWDRFLPQFNKKNVQTKKPKKAITKKKYTPFPPAQQPSKIDMQLESGEYFMKEAEKKLKKVTEKADAQQEKVLQKKREKEAVFVAPVEENVVAAEAWNSASSSAVDIDALKRKLKNKNLKIGKTIEASSEPGKSTEVVVKKKKNKSKVSESVEEVQDAPVKKKRKKSVVEVAEVADISTEPLKKKKKKKSIVDVAESEVADISSESQKKKKKKSIVEVAEVTDIISSESPKKKKKKKKVSDS